MIQIFVGLWTEGTTDARFLKPIVEKTLIKAAFACRSQIEIELLVIEKERNVNFIQEILQASKNGVETFGMTMLCVHTDADSVSNENVYQHKIIPVKNVLSQQNDTEFCKNLVAIVPIQETEAWMLADKELLKAEIGTNKPDTELNIHRHPESIANPKEVIEQAILIARSEITKDVEIICLFLIYICQLDKVLI